MPAPDPYVTLDDVRAICPYVDQFAPDEDQFLVQRRAARRWFDAAVMAAAGVREPIVVEADDQVIHANAHKAAAEILIAQITPTVDPSTYQAQAARYLAIAEGMVSTMIVTVTDAGGYRLRLGISRRG